jgi:hypothetical protein
MTKHDWHEYYFKDHDIFGIGLRLGSCFPEFGDRIKKVRIATCDLSIIEVLRVSQASGAGWYRIRKEDFDRVTKPLNLEICES